MQTKQWLIILFFMLGTTSLLAQETVRQRIEQRRQTDTEQQTDITNIRMGQADQYTDESIENAKWVRIIYRHLDLTKEINAPLYYPVTPKDGKMNLFSLLFNLLQKNRIPAYEYLDGREEFTEEYRMDFQELLDRFEIYYEMEEDQVKVNDADIPSNEVEGYFVKEAYYFDTPSSTFRKRPLAICPVLHRQDNHGAISHYPLFWVQYDEISPFARRIPVMGSSLNNSMNGTIDDFFRLRKYDGEIYKAQNPRNLTISQYTTTPEEMKKEQERIEQELIDFEEKLWKKENPIYTPQQVKKNRRAKKQPSQSSLENTSVSMRDRRY